MDCAKSLCLTIARKTKVLLDHPLRGRRFGSRAVFVEERKLLDESAFAYLWMSSEHDAPAATACKADLYFLSREHGFGM